MPIYFFHGEEDFLIEKEIKALKNKILGDSADALNFRTIDNPDFKTLDEILRTTGTLFGETMFVIKADKYFLETKSKIKLEDKDNAILIESFKNVAPSVHIILNIPIERGSKKKVDGRKKLYKEVIKIATNKEFPSYRFYEDYKIIPLLKDIIKEKDIQITNDLLTQLIHHSGASIRNLDSQLEKLKLHIYPEKQVTKKALEEVCLADEDIIIALDYILANQNEKALNYIYKITEKSHPLEVFGFLQISISNLLKTKIYSKTLPHAEIARKLGQNEFLTKKNLEKLRSISQENLIDLRINLTQAEYKIKSGETDANLALCNMLLGGA